MWNFFLLFFFFNDTATTEIYTLSLHDALPICQRGCDEWRGEPAEPDCGHDLPECVDAARRRCHLRRDAREDQRNRILGGPGSPSGGLVRRAGRRHGPVRPRCGRVPPGLVSGRLEDRLHVRQNDRRERVLPLRRLRDGRGWRWALASDERWVGDRSPYLGAGRDEAGVR